MAPKKKEESQFVTEERFSALENSVNSLIDIMKAQIMDKKEPEPVKSETPLEKEIRKASPDSFPVNPEWKEKAQEIIGEAFEDCEMQHLRNGGVLFTVIIKKEFSNASPDYWKMHHSDRRTREIGNEGFGGVEAWCKLIAQNLRRPRNTYA